MFSWVEAIWRRGSVAYRLYKDARPAAIAASAAELAHLAQLAACSTLPVHDATSLHRLQEEMLQLAQMATLPEFARLPLDRRQALARNIAHSQRILLSTMQLGLSTSDRIQ